MALTYTKIIHINLCHNCKTERWWCEVRLQAAATNFTILNVCFSVTLSHNVPCLSRRRQPTFPLILILYSIDVLRHLAHILKRIFQATHINTHILSKGTYCILDKSTLLCFFFLFFINFIWLEYINDVMSMSCLVRHQPTSIPT